MKQLDSYTTLMGVEQVKGKREPLFEEDKLLDAVATNLILKESNMFIDKAKDTNIDYQKAAEILDKNRELYKKSLHEFGEQTKLLSETIKKTSASVRDSSEKLAQALIRIEKQANFNNLEKYVLLLERASKAMYELSELEKNGKLEKITNALK
jgi:hypothetical protein